MSIDIKDVVEIVENLESCKKQNNVVTYMKSRVADIAKVVGVHPNTIRNWADQGLIESKRDFRGWRIIPDKLKAIQKIQGLMSGQLPTNKFVGL